MKYNKFKKFIHYLKDKNQEVYIQPHNFPDPDALASSYGLKKIFDHFKIDSKIIYFGPRLSLLNKELIEVFDLEIEQIDRRKNYELKIAIDGHPENANFIETKGDFIGCFDHHIQKLNLENNNKSNRYRKSNNNTVNNKSNNNKNNEEIVSYSVFFEVDPDIGSTSTIIAYYLLHFNIPITKKLATFLSIGIYTDTKGLSRKTSMKDLYVFKKFYSKIDKDIFSFFTGNSFEKKDLPLLNLAINNLKIYEDKGITFIKGSFSPSLLGIIADTVLRIVEVNFVLIAGFIEDKVYLSTRSISSKYNCFEYFKTKFKNIAYFGGHNEMAGGQLIEKNLSEKEVFKIIEYK